MILRLKMTLELHLGLRLGLQCKTKCVDWGYIRGYTFYMVLTTFTPLIMTKKNGLTPIFAVYPPQAVRKRHFEAYHSWQSRYCDST